MDTTRKSSDRAMQSDVRSEILRFENVSVGYDEGGAILHDITFDIRRGEVAGLVALDGRGKTTLVKCAAGLLPPSEGTVRWDSHDVYAMSFREDQRFRAHTAVVLEGGALFANRSIYSNVALPARYHSGGKERDLERFVHRLLERVHFNENPEALPWQVSAKGRRLAAFARALAREPELVIVDSFFEALEVHDWKLLMELVLELNVQNGVSFLIVGELQPQLFQVAERVLVLEGGRVLAHDFKRQLYKDERIRKAFEETEDQKLRDQMAKLAVAKLPKAPTKPAPPPRAIATPVAAAPDASDDYAAAALAMESDDGLEPSPPEAPAMPTTPAPVQEEGGDSERTLTLDEGATDALLREARSRADEKILDEASRIEKLGSLGETVDIDPPSPGEKEES